MASGVLCFRQQDFNTRLLSGIRFFLVSGLLLYYHYAQKAYPFSPGVAEQPSQRLVNPSRRLAAVSRTLTDDNHEAKHRSGLERHRKAWMCHGSQVGHPSPGSQKE